MSHTPGPWTVNTGWSQGTGDCYTINEAPGFAFDDKGEIPANARLIAAAPELLAVLKYIAEKRIELQFDTGSPLMRRVYTAIAKAEGREP